VGDATALADRKKLYLEWREACHLADGSGRIGTSLIAAQHTYPGTATDVGLFEAVAMRPFNDKMTQDQILRVTATSGVLERTGPDGTTRGAVPGGGAWEAPAWPFPHPPKGRRSGQ
jgi:hypothetical protein